MVVALQGIVSRQVSPRQPAVLTVGVIEGGTKENVIPEVVTLRGTVRTLQEEVREQMPGRIEAVAGGICAAYGATCEVEYRRGYDVLVNEPGMTALARAAAADVVGEEGPAAGGAGHGRGGLRALPAARPGLLRHHRRGGPRRAPPERHGAHSPRFALDPDCLPYGVAWYRAVARRYFAQRA